MVVWFRARPSSPSVLSKLQARQKAGQETLSGGGGVQEMRKGVGWGVMEGSQCLQKSQRVKVCSVKYAQEMKMKGNL